MWIEAIGYIATAIIAVSMFMTSMVSLRVINSIGNATFVIYALIIHSYPTALLNFILVAINVYQLARMTRGRKNYDLVKTQGSDGYLSFLIETFGEDIHSWFPEFSPKAEEADAAFIICYDGNPAGIFMGKDGPDSGIEILLDYAFPAYRDTSVGSFLYEQLRKMGYKTLVFGGNAPGHTGYLEKMGYKKQGEKYVLSL